MINNFTEARKHFKELDTYIQDSIEIGDIDHNYMLELLGNIGYYYEQHAEFLQDRLDRIEDILMY